MPIIGLPNLKSSISSHRRRHVRKKLRTMESRLVCDEPDRPDPENERSAQGGHEQRDEGIGRRPNASRNQRSDPEEGEADEVDPHRCRMPKLKTFPHTLHHRLPERWGLIGRPQLRGGTEVFESLASRRLQPDCEPSEYPMRTWLPVGRAACWECSAASLEGGRREGERSGPRELQRGTHVRACAHWSSHCGRGRLGVGCVPGTWHDRGAGGYTIHVP